MQQLRARLFDGRLHLRDSRLAAFDTALRAFHRALRGAKFEFPLLELIARQQALLEKRIRALEILSPHLQRVLVEVEPRGRVLQFRLFQIGLGLIERRLRELGIEPHQFLASRDAVPFPHSYGLHDPGSLRAKVDRDRGLDLPRDQ